MILLIKIVFYVLKLLRNHNCFKIELFVDKGHDYTYICCLILIFVFSINIKVQIFSILSIT